MMLDNPACHTNVLGVQKTGRLKGYVDLHTHPLANLAFGGKLFYGGVDVGSELRVDPDCHQNVRATSMEQALGHCNCVDGGWGTDNKCGDDLRKLVIHQLNQQTQPATDPSDDSRGAPDFNEWPAWNDLTHQKMWVDWLRRSYDGGLRVMVALAVNNRTLSEMVCGSGDTASDDKGSADLQIKEIISFVKRHSDFMEIALSSTDLERIVRENKLAVVVGIEIDNPGDFNKVSRLTTTEIEAEINRLFSEGVRYIFPIHLLDNPFGGTAAYEDLMNYSSFRESGHWWNLSWTNTSSYAFQKKTGILFSAGVRAKLGTSFNPPSYGTQPQGDTGQLNRLGLLDNGGFAIKAMMRHGMLIDIDHMSANTRSSVLQIAQNNTYPVNSGHNCLWHQSGNGRGTERNLAASEYKIIRKLHGMAGVGTGQFDAVSWAGKCIEILEAVPLTPEPANQPFVLALGTDTNGLCPGMPPRGTFFQSPVQNPFFRLTKSHPMMYLRPPNPPPNPSGGPFNTIQFMIFTGGDDLRKDSKVTATLFLASGSQEVITIKDHNIDGFKQYSNNGATASLRGPIHPKDLQQIVITLVQGTKQAQTADNWNVNYIAVSLLNRNAGAIIHYSDAYPRSSLGTRWFDYNIDGVAHYGMLPEFFLDVNNAPNGSNLLKNNLIYGADYFLQTWKICEAKKAHIQ